jgi:chromosome segregation ATPase
VKCKGLEQELEGMQREKQDAEQKSRNSYRRLEEATKKIKELEESLDEQEQVLIKRHNEINSINKENRLMKEDLDFIRQKYGTVAEIKQKMEVAEMKEKKIAELVATLDNSIVSDTFTHSLPYQLSKYSNRVRTSCRATSA